MPDAPKHAVVVRADTTGVLYLCCSCGWRQCIGTSPSAAFIGVKSNVHAHVATAKEKAHAGRS